MKCPSCGQTVSKVVDSRPSPEQGEIRRRRECEHCGARFTTYERCEGIIAMVIKRDGRREPFDPEEENLAILQEDVRVLVVGAGGLGCEILKNLALSGVKDIEVIDLDIIDLSNLNRQFLFRKKDIGQPKSKVAAEFVMKRVPGCSIKWYQKPLQEFDEGFYKVRFLFILRLFFSLSLAQNRKNDPNVVSPRNSTW